jgi:hypothetical protein
MDGTCLIPDELEFLFWFLRPMCLQSPMRRPEQVSFYQFQDHNERAERDLEMEEERMKAMSIFLGRDAWPDAQLKTLAKGLNIAGVDDMTPLVVKSELKKLAYKNPREFYTRASSRDIIFSGKIQEAIDGKVFVLKSLNGMQRWYMGAEELLPITYGQDPLNELKNMMAEKWYLYADKVNDALAKNDISAKLNNPVNDAVFKAEPELKIKAELTDKELKFLAEIKKNDWLEEKMKKIHAYDKSEPDKMHPSQLKSWKENEEMYEAWKKENGYE